MTSRTRNGSPTRPLVQPIDYTGLRRKSSKEVSISTPTWSFHLVRELHAALKALDDADTAEQLAQAALSVRRFVMRLADALFPARASAPGERKLGKEDYLNRLAAYAEQALSARPRRPIAGELDELGRRLASLIEQANAGVHETDVQRSRIDRLVVALLALTYDLLTLREPPRRLPSAPHDVHVRDMIREMLKDDQ